MPILTGVNFSYGSDATKAHMKQYVTQIEDIINIITTFMCDKDKSDNSYTNNEIIAEIKKKYSTFETFCVENKTPCPAGSEVFSDKRLKEIIDKIQNDNLYRRMCKFKKSVILGNINVPVANVIYSAKSIPLQLSWMYGYPFWYNAVKKSLDFPEKVIAGGGPNDSENPYQLGRKTNLLNQSVPNKYVDFEEFEHQYEDYHKLNNLIGGNGHTINVKMCKMDSNHKMKCTSNTFHLEDKSEEYNIETKGHNRELEQAYNALQRFKKIQSLEHALDEIDILLSLIKYYTLPLKSIECAEKINRTLN